MPKRLFRNSSVVCAVWVALTGTLAAQTDSVSGSVPLPGVGQSDLWPSVARLFGSLILVLVLAWGALWLLRRTLKGRGAGPGGSGVRVLERVYLAPRKSIEVVQVGRRILVLGVTDNQIGMLTEVTPEDLGLDRVAGSADSGDAAITGRRTRPAERLWQEARRKLGGGLRAIRLIPGRAAQMN